MREIKFRVWSKKEKKMYYGDRQHEPNMIGFDGKIFATGSTGVMCNYGCSADYINWCNPEEDYELMEYTGFKDKYGKEVFEGDILRCKIWNPMSCQRDCVLEVIVVWNQSVGSWKFQDIRHNFADLSWIFIDGVKIIGNIYENPELLKEELK
ncbi:YopX family protein [Thermoanaerobacterium sp. RBIITD]|uniref:YopX family protein n=1 Tax=Thermoanaerobacterium sp. RBIITD TaxID=1550240 RepID=UPI000BB9155D|nr:YopX family protein [Thermoanaerobacterium sp. RBIITD]SNX54218.1 phage uncharacterized protein TIGR01671 [Thermoanaerobacterium sp. RBIITD]